MGPDIVIGVDGHRFVRCLDSTFYKKRWVWLPLLYKRVKREHDGAMARNWDNGSDGGRTTIFSGRLSEEP